MIEEPEKNTWEWDLEEIQATIDGTTWFATVTMAGDISWKLKDFECCSTGRSSEEWVGKPINPRVKSIGEAYNADTDTVEPLPEGGGMPSLRWRWIRSICKKSISRMSILRLGRVFSNPLPPNLDIGSGRTKHLSAVQPDHRQHLLRQILKQFLAGRGVEGTSPDLLPGQMR